MADLIDPSVGVFMAMALGQLSLTLLFAFSQPFQDLEGAMDSFWPVRQPLEEAEQHRKRHLRHQTFRTWLPWWILANDATTLLFMAIDAGHYWAGDRPFAVASFGGKSYGCYGVVVWGFGLVLRFVFSFGSETSTIRDSVLIFVSFSAVMCLTPSYMQPNAMLAPLVLLEVVPEPKWYGRMQGCFIPVNVAVTWLTGTSNGTAIEFLHILVAEAVGSGAVVVAHYKSDWAFSRQVFATMAAERAAEEAKSVSNALQQLLSVTCDACASLSSTLQVLQPSRSLLAVLKVKENQIRNRAFTDFVMPEDHGHFQSILSFSSKTPNSGLVHLQDNNQVSFKANIFLVKLGSCGHFIGITKEGHEASDAESIQGAHVPDMHFLLGSESSNNGPFSEPPKHGYPFVPLARPLRDMEELKQINLVIDPLSMDFTARSVTFDFAELPGNQQRLANLTEWLEPRGRDEMQRWIQEQVNLSVNGQGSQSVMEGVELLSPGGSTVVGDLCITSCGPSDAPDGQTSMTKAMMQLCSFKPWL
eukprot:symbB.v1.2.022897.t1/scaffold2015.1/size92276/10